MYLLKAPSHMLFHGGHHYCSVFSVPSNGYNSSSDSVQTPGLQSRVSGDFETTIETALAGEENSDTSVVLQNFCACH